MLPSLRNFIRLLVVLAIVAGGLYARHLWRLADENLQRVEVLTDRPDTAGTTWLLVGSDERVAGIWYDGTRGARSDMMMLLHQAENGQTALISIPRYLFLNIPGIGYTVLNNVYGWAGPSQLIDTIEDFSGLKIDHYVATGFEGIYGVVDALHGIELCLDFDVNDEGKSYLEWESGCHLVDSETALAFARMRYSDPLDDVGRASRHRQMFVAMVNRMMEQEFLLSPDRHRALITAGLGALRVDENFQVNDFGTLALAVRAATGPNGVTGHPPIVPAEVQVGNVEAVVFDPNRIAQFWLDLRNGNLTTGVLPY